MPVSIKTQSEVTGAQQSYVRSELPQLDPTVTRRRGYIGGITKALALGLHMLLVRFKRYADREPFPQTATGDFLYQGWWADITELTRTPATEATGRVVLTGTAGTTLNAGSVLSSGNVSYTTDGTVGVVSQSINISSLTRNGTTAIAETATAHYLATGMTVTIAGADQTEYNGSITITVTASNEFTFEVSGSPTTPATGTIAVSGSWGNATITAEDTGPDGNIDAGGTLEISSAPSGIDSTAIVTFETVSGGTEIEDQESYRERVLEALGTDFGMFSSDEIKIVAKQIAGVTRVWVIEATTDGSNGVLPGQVQIYFVRDGDANIFPSGLEVTTVKDHIVDSIMPAQTSPDDVMVSAPTKQTVDFTFTALSPDTASMRLAISASLEQFFEEAVDLGVDITQDDYRCAIKDAYDTERQQALTSFTLSSPTGTISVSSGALPVLGTITWPT
ncbi:MAG: baseplate J/gp47 family protein [Filomicrobium sp.]